jgi:hypothetical protein
MTGGGSASEFIHDDHLMREAVGEVWATEKVAGAKRKRQLDDEKKSCRRRSTISQCRYYIHRRERERRAATNAFI